MSLLSRLFGRREASTSATEADPVEYKGFRITPAPVREEGGWRIAARVEKEVGGEMKSHQLIRADTFGDEAVAAEEAVGKAKLTIDQMGERIFG